MSIYSAIVNLEGIMSKTHSNKKLVTEKIEVQKRDVMCDGGKGSLGHPAVYLRIPSNKKEVICPYCSRLFVMKNA